MVKTPEDKAATRDRTNARNRAFHSRYREFTEAKATAEALVRSRHAEVVDRAAAVEAAARKAWQAEIAEIDQQIAELQQRRAGLRDATGTPLDLARADLRRVNDHLRTDLLAAENEVRDRFPDMRSSYSPSLWGETEIGKSLTQEQLDAKESDQVRR